MKPPKLNKLTKEQLPGSPSWIVALLYFINQFFEQTWNCLTNITIGDNVIGQFNTFQVQTTADYLTFDFPSTIVPWKYRDRVQSVVLSQISETKSNAVQTLPVTIDWRQTTAGVNIRYITGLKASTAYTVTVLML